MKLLQCCQLWQFIAQSAETAKAEDFTLQKTNNLLNSLEFPEPIIPNRQAETAVHLDWSYQEHFGLRID